MLDHVLLALWFFAPAGAANVTPILVANAGWFERLNRPMDGGRTWRGKRLLGDNKTWRGMITGTVVAIAVVYLQIWLTGLVPWIQSFSGIVDYGHVNGALLGLLLGVGALGGDALESFFKRQNAIRPGKSWFPFDQIDYVIGGAVLSAIVIRLTVADYMWVFVLWSAIHLFSSYLGWRWSLKAHPI